MMSTDKEKKLTLFKQLFVRNLKESSILQYDDIETESNTTHSGDINYPVFYNLNKYGYRGENFINKEEVLILGCSHTFGSGLPEEFIWSKIFSNKVNKKSHNLAQPGDSIQGQIRKAFEYFKEFGNPKTIVGFFPYGRMELPYIPNIFGKINKDGSSDDGRNLPIIQKIILEGNQNKIDKYSKIPHNPESVIPLEVTIFYSFIFIQILEQYCKTNGIDLIWTLHNDNEIEEYLNLEIPELLNNFVSIKNIFVDSPMCKGFDDPENQYTLRCHQELSSHPLFNHASDCNHNKKQKGHFGIHINQHVADVFYKEYLKRMDKQ